VHFHAYVARTFAFLFRVSMSFSRKRTQKCARACACAEGRLVGNGEARGENFFFIFGEKPRGGEGRNRLLSCFLGKTQPVRYPICTRDTEKGDGIKIYVDIKR